MRRLPAELRRALATETRAKVAEPLAADNRRSWRGAYAPALSAQTKARVQTDPQVVIGGAKRVVSGGANARQLVYGTEWGGGKRVTAIPSRPGRRGHRRRTTQQFPRTGQHAVYGTIHDTLDATFDRWVGVIDDIIERTFDRG
jgi:hypothetical protein